MVSLTLNNLKFMKKIGMLLLVFIGMVSYKNEIKNTDLQVLIDDVFIKFLFSTNSFWISII